MYYVYELEKGGLGHLGVQEYLDFFTIHNKFMYIVFTFIFIYFCSQFNMCILLTRLRGNNIILFTTYIMEHMP